MPNKIKYIICNECGHDEYYETKDGDYQLCKNCMAGLNLKKDYDQDGYEIPEVWDCSFENYTGKLFFNGFTIGRKFTEINFSIANISMIKSAILYREAYDLGYELNEKIEKLTIDEIHKEFKPVAMKLFEAFYDNKLAFQPSHFDNMDYENMNMDKLREHLNGDLFYVCDRWSPQRLNRILEQLFTLFEKREEAEK